MWKSLEILGRKWVATLVGVLLAMGKRKVELSGAAKILIVRLDRRVGNLILTTPMLDSLKQHFPQSEVHLLVHNDVQHILTNHPAADTIWCFHKWGPRRWWTLLRKLRQERFELCIDAGDPTSISVNHALMSRLARAKHLIGFARGGLKRLYSAPVAQLPPGSHETALRMALLLPLGICEEAPMLSYFPTRQVHKILDSQGRNCLDIAEPCIVLTPGARLNEKIASSQLMQKIAVRLCEASFTVLLAPGPQEEHLALAIEQEVKDLRLIPKTDLDDLATLIQKAGRLVGNDTGTTHLAEAVGAQTLVLFHSTDKLRHGPRRPGSLAVDLRNLSPEKKAERALHALEEWLKTTSQP